MSVLYGGGSGLSPAAAGVRFISQATPGVPDAPENEVPFTPGERFGWAVAAGNFNGDQYADLAVGVPNESITVAGRKQYAAGAVNVLYGSPAGLTGAGAQMLHQAGNIQGHPEGQRNLNPGDQFGWSLAAGDLNGDGRDDLAIGVVGEDTGGRENDGGVHVLFGFSNGITTVGNQFWGQDSEGVDFDAESGDHFGWSLAIGNLGKSAQADLAIGVAHESLVRSGQERAQAGAINILYGSPTGPSAVGDRVFHQGSVDGTGVIQGTQEAHDIFAWVLAAGDLNGDGRDDLAVGVVGEDTGGRENDGGANVLFGSSDGVIARGNRLLGQDSAGVEFDAESGDQFGYGLAIANFGKSAHADLAVGVPGESVRRSGSERDRAGAVNVLYGSPTGPNAAGDQIWHQGFGDGTDVVKGKVEAGDQFGATLHAAAFDAGPEADLAVGVSTEDLEGDTGTVHEAGAVNVLYGNPSIGLSAVNNDQWHQGVPGVSPQGEGPGRDFFGFSLG